MGDTSVKPAANAGTMGTTILILNIIIPGLGTLIHGVSAGKPGYIFRGILEYIFTFVLFIGYAFSLYDGIVLKKEYDIAQKEYDKQQHKDSQQQSGKTL